MKTLLIASSMLIAFTIGCSDSEQSDYDNAYKYTADKAASMSDDEYNKALQNAVQVDTEGNALHEGARDGILNEVHNRKPL